MSEASFWKNKLSLALLSGGAWLKNCSLNNYRSAERFDVRLLSSCLEHVRCVFSLCVCLSVCFLSLPLCRHTLDKQCLWQYSSVFMWFIATHSSLSNGFVWTMPSKQHRILSEMPVHCAHSCSYKLAWEPRYTVDGWSFGRKYEGHTIAKLPRRRQSLINYFSFESRTRRTKLICGYMISNSNIWYYYENKMNNKTLNCSTQALGLWVWCWPCLWMTCAWAYNWQLMVTPSCSNVTCR